MEVFQYLHGSLVFIQHGISLIGILVILTGVLIAFAKYAVFLSGGNITARGVIINAIRLDLGRILILGLEFIVAADLIGTTTAPDYYALGLAGIIVVIRTLLSYSINGELATLDNEK